MTLYLARYLLPITAPPIEDGALLLRNGRIEAVGRRRDLQRGWTGQVVDFGDALMLPPLVNAHAHLELTHYPEWALRAGEETNTGENFVDWILRLVRIKRDQSDEELSRSLATGLEKSLQAGTGAIGDILSCPAACSVYRNSPLKGRFFLEVLGLDETRVNAHLKCLETILQGRPVGFLQPGLAPHAPYTLSSTVIKEIRSTAAGKALAIHFAESAEESVFLQHASGAIAERLYPQVGWSGQVPQPTFLRPVAWLDAHGLLSPPPLLIHGVQVSQNEAELLRRRGVTVVLCPRSNDHLQVGRAPVEYYQAAGVPLALGTDSAASCSSLSIWDELAFAYRLFYTCLSPRELLAMATVNGARALGLQGEMGALEVGWGGNFLVLPTAGSLPIREQEAYLCSRGGDLAGGRFYLAGREILQSI